MYRYVSGLCMVSKYWEASQFSTIRASDNYSIRTNLQSNRIESCFWTQQGARSSFHVQPQFLTAREGRSDALKKKSLVHIEQFPCRKLHLSVAVAIATVVLVPLSLYKWATASTSQGRVNSDDMVVPAVSCHWVRRSVVTFVYMTVCLCSLSV